MANSFGKVAVDVIAQEALTRLIQKLSFIKNVHRDFSTTSLQKGQNVVTHIITELASSDVTFGGAKAGGGTNPDGYSASSKADLIQTDVSINLDKHKAVTFTLSDGERDSSSIDMFNRYAEVASYGLAKGIVDVLLGSDTLGAKAASISKTIDAGDLTMDKLIDLGAAFDADGIPEAGRWLVAHPKVLAELEKEVTAVTNATFSVNSSIVEGGVNRIRGFDIYAYNGGVLKDGLTAGDCSMVAGFSDSLALVTAPPSSPPDTSGASLAYITDPETGLTIQRRQWYDADKALYSFALTLYLGSKLTSGTRAYKMLAK
jgi:hypothetical protein